MAVKGKSSLGINGKYKMQEGDGARATKGRARYGGQLTDWYCVDWRTKLRRKPTEYDGRGMKIESGEKGKLREEKEDFDCSWSRTHADAVGRRKGGKEQGERGRGRKGGGRCKERDGQSI